MAMEIEAVPLDCWPIFSMRAIPHAPGQYRRSAPPSNQQGGSVVVSIMSTGHPKKRKYTSTPVKMAPLAVPPEAAAEMLGIRPSKLYALLRDGEVQSFQCGRARRVVVESIHDYIARRVADARSSGWTTWPHNPIARRQREDAGQAGAHSDQYELQSQ
jgi:excisionase family DNA binding protein